MPAQVHTIPCGLSLAYLIETDKTLVLVDAGQPRCEGLILRKMQTLHRDDLSLIFITHAHFDHYGSAKALREITGAPIAIHHADADLMARAQTLLGSSRGFGKFVARILPVSERIFRPIPTEADILFEDGDTFNTYSLDAIALHTPGHTSGSSCLLVENRFAFAGDLISTTGKPHAQRYFAHDWNLVTQSVIRIQEKNPEWVYTGHGRDPMSCEILQKL